MPGFDILIQINLTFLYDDPDSRAGTISDPHSPGSYSEVYIVVYPNCFNADPDPAVFVNADPDPDPGFRLDDQKLEKIYS
jgi:hypothetical protein